MNNPAFPQLPKDSSHRMSLSPEESQEVLSAIRAGEVDALLVTGPHGQRVYSIEGADLFHRTLIENMNGGALILDPEGTILFANGPFGEMVRCAGGALLNRRLNEFVAPGSRRRLSRLLTEGQAGKCEGELVLQTSCDATMHVKLFLSGIDHGAVCAIVTDLTEQKRAEEALRQSERLAAIGQTITGLSHESRNALQRSLTCLEILARRYADEPNVLRLVSEAQSAQTDLQRVLEEVREYAAPLALELRDIDMASCWREAWDYLAPIRQGRHVSLSEDLGDVDTRCLLDPFRMRQVFRNLLENSLAACEDPVEIQIACRASEAGGRPGLCVSVADNGPGLSSEQAERIFEPFYTTKTKGTGLGTAIVKRIVESHGGRIWVEPGPGVGLTVEMVLPCRAE